MDSSEVYRIIEFISNLNSKNLPWNVIGLAVAIISLFLTYIWNKQSEKEHKKIIDTVKNNNQTEKVKNNKQIEKTTTEQKKLQTDITIIRIILTIAIVILLSSILFTFYKTTQIPPDTYTPPPNTYTIPKPKIDKPDTYKASENSFIITEIEFANTDYDDSIINSYSTDAKFRSSKLKFLSPQITYTSSISGYKDLYFKIIKPNGDLETGLSSQNEYTYKHSLFVSQGKNKKNKLSGWGSREGGTYKSGNYVFEIWNENKKLYTGRFYVKDDAPTPQSPKTTNIAISYPGDPYGCLLPIRVTIAGQTFIPQGGTLFFVNNIPIGQHSYTIEGTITCAYIGSCEAFGSGKIDVQSYKVFAVRWANSSFGRCNIWLE